MIGSTWGAFRNLTLFHVVQRLANTTHPFRVATTATAQGTDVVSNALQMENPHLSRARAVL
jgi:hypothetical protein